MFICIYVCIYIPYCPIPKQHDKIPISNANILLVNFTWNIFLSGAVMQL